jgi:xylulose-5-phosphate/fructose-6-phosphate phosphoketolase
MSPNGMRAAALWRAVVYVSVCMLHLDSNVLLATDLRVNDIKRNPAGHWGTVPGTALALAHVALAGEAYPSCEIVPVLGAGHAGIVQLAVAYLTGELQREAPTLTVDSAGLERLVQSFPDVGGLGAEVTPRLWAGDFVGGRIGGALPFAFGAGHDAPGRVMVPILGDGECETPTTAATWLAGPATSNAKVLPILHVNGFRMGGRSLLAAFGDERLEAWAAGLGWSTRIVHIHDGHEEEHELFHAALLAALNEVGGGSRTVLVLRCAKGFGGPAAVAGRLVLGTARTHKTPLTSARLDATQRSQLQAWLNSYVPAELFDAGGVPHGELKDALTGLRCNRLPTSRRGAPRPEKLASTVASPDFATAVRQVVHRHAAGGRLRVFSPDELASNRLPEIAGQRWATEVLAEEVLLEGLAGWTASGRVGLLVTYEAFSTLMIAGLVAHLKQRRLAAPVPSLNILLTSLGWHNTYTHGDPTIATALLATRDPAVRVLTPCDPARLALVLDDCLASTGRANLIVAGKHSAARAPAALAGREVAVGLAVWPWLDPHGEPDLVIAVCGDLPATVVGRAITVLTTLGRSIRIVGICDLTVLGRGGTRPGALGDDEFEHFFGVRAALLVVTLGHAAAIWSLLEGRYERPVEVIGWVEPPSPVAQDELAELAGMDVRGVVEAATRLLARMSPEVAR